MEIITGVERRRRWRLEEKLRIVAETEELGASFVAVARRHEVSRGLLWNWRQQVRRGDLMAEPMPMFELATTRSGRRSSVITTRALGG
jgi:transposase